MSNWAPLAARSRSRSAGEAIPGMVATPADPLPCAIPAIPHHPDPMGRPPAGDWHLGVTSAYLAMHDRLRHSAAQPPGAGGVPPGADGTVPSVGPVPRPPEKVNGTASGPGGAATNGGG